MRRVAVGRVLQRFGGLAPEPEPADQVDDEVRAGMERLGRGPENDRAAALFLTAALRVGVLSRIALSDACAADRDTEVDRDALLLRDDLRGYPDRLDAALRGAVEAHGTLLYERAVLESAEKSGDWQCALTCLACSLVDVGCEACQQCSNIPPHV